MDTDFYQVGALTIDLYKTQVKKNGQPVHLTRHEWAVLCALARQFGGVVSSRELLQEAWGPEYGNESDYIRTYIHRLRSKLESDPQHPCYIILERGLGYRLTK